MNESKLKADAMDSVGELPNLLLGESGYPYLPAIPLTPAPKQNKFKGTYKPDTKHSQAIERCKEDRGGEFSNISLSSKVTYKFLG